jgi:toxin CcdB
MARLDVHARRDGQPGLLLDVQADLLSDLQTRLVVPLFPVGTVPRPLARLTPVFDVGGKPHVMATQLATAVAKDELGKRVGQLPGAHDAVLAALDLLLTGV